MSSSLRDDDTVASLALEVIESAAVQQRESITRCAQAISELGSAAVQAQHSIRSFSKTLEELEVRHRDLFAKLHEVDRGAL